ncbi:hypothetical protein [Methylobacterium gnaphalii]|uniref:Uncharacterized protein n=1 Tax=Methylobacterium gnaphalii TaxID=1010610 RepID=A0A512JLD1_9HYPH|nr:hypothetical protein [Methylobacterium gnaphalii]GEP10769.1 hypothetical protein MGN01_26140 [Methylobacterium gnaphalii]GLS49308.1 hypothetical protein GCM10007885_21560 [Methylobacterium gnaphalii]
MTFGACGGVLVMSGDARLNAAWKCIYTTGGETHHPDLLEEDRVWIALTEAGCRS